jgi:hypothetical protein
MARTVKVEVEVIGDVDDGNLSGEVDVAIAVWALYI